MEQQPSFQFLPILSESDGFRRLQSTSSGGLFLILSFIVILVILFCNAFSSFPRFISAMRNRNHQSMHYRRHQQHISHNEAVEVIQLSLNNLTQMGRNVDEVRLRGTTNGGMQTTYNQSIRAMSLEDRREFIHNVLVSKKINIIEESDDTQDCDVDEECPKKDIMNTKFITLCVSDVVDVDGNNTSEVVRENACPICLVEYAEGDVICWSQNTDCHHYFHRDCICEWLLRNEECPLCRHNYLRLDGEEMGEGEVRIGGVESHQNNNNSQSNHAFVRGMELIHLVQSLEAIAETRPNTTIRLQDVELATGQRGNVEIQRPLDEQNAGLNVRVSNDNGENSAETMSTPQ